MKKLLLAALAAGALIGAISAASAQVYLDFGRPQYRERYYDDYDGSRYRRACPRGYGWMPGTGCIPNNCRRGYTWQDGRCKPFRGY